MCLWDIVVNIASTLMHKYFEAKLDIDFFFRVFKKKKLCDILYLL